MWNGHFSPSLRKSVGGASWAADDGRSESELSSPDDDEVEGTLTVTLGNNDYVWPGVTYGQWVDFQDSGLSGGWVNGNLPISYVGDWGWPWGRQ